MSQYIVKNNQAILKIIVALVFGYVGGYIGGLEPDPVRRNVAVISGIVVDDKIEIGQHVRSIFRRVHADGHSGLINYGFKFELVD